MTRPVREIRNAAEFAAAFPVSHETLEKLELYARLLTQWQKAVNLVAPASLPHLWHRHMADSAQLFQYAPPKPTIWVDIGSGGGFPGLVTAILLANQQECVVHLVESNSRKCAFLSEVARQTSARVRVHNARVADVAKSRAIPPADVVSARALAPLDALLELAQPFFGDASAGLFLKGREAASEVADARKRWAFSLVTHPSITDPDGHVLEIRQPKLIGSSGFFEVASSDKRKTASGPSCFRRRQSKRRRGQDNDGDQSRNRFGGGR